MPQLQKYDPLNILATDEQITEKRNELERSPIPVLDFMLDCDPTSEERMRSTIQYWDYLPESEGVVVGSGENRKVYWTLEDNTSHAFSKNELTKILEEMIKNRTIRSSILFTASVRFKQNPSTTLRMIQLPEAWGIVP